MSIPISAITKHDLNYSMHNNAQSCHEFHVPYNLSHNDLLTDLWKVQKEGNVNDKNQHMLSLYSESYKELMDRKMCGVVSKISSFHCVLNIYQVSAVISICTDI